MPGEDQFADLFLPVFVLESATKISPVFISSQATEYKNWILIVYCIATGLLMFHYLWGHIRILFLLRREPKQKRNGFVLLKSGHTDTPYSYFRYLVLPDDIGSDARMHIILSHEKAHITQKHSWDLLWLNLSAIFLWFNPVSWLIMREIKTIHEYLADQRTIEENPDKVSYFRLLLAEYTGVAFTNIVNQFSYLPLKERIMMMKKAKKSKRNVFRYAILLPVIALLLSFSYANNSGQRGLKSALSGKVRLDDGLQNGSKMTKDRPQEEKVFVEVEHKPEYKGGQAALMRFLSKNIKYPKLAQKKGTQGTVYIQFVIEKDGSISNIKVVRGIGDGCDEEGVRVVKLMKNWNPGIHHGKKVRVKYILPIKYILKANKNSENKTEKQ
jgi:TonB family protein